MEKHEIESTLRNAPVPEPSLHLQDQLLAGLTRLPAEPAATRPAPPRRRPAPWRYAAAALFVLGLLTGFLLLGGPQGGGVAWAAVTSQASKIEQVHFYAFEFRQGRLQASRESWYAGGRVIDLLPEGRYGVDDGKFRTLYDRAGAMLSSESSWLTGLAQASAQQDFFTMLAQGVFAYDEEEIGSQKPSDVGDDLLVYRFGEPRRFDGSIQKVSITVGRRSLLPVQMKIFYQGGPEEFDLFVFDFEQKQPPALVARLANLPLSGPASLTGRWRVDYETAWGERGELALEIKGAGPDYRLTLKESFDEWAMEVCQVRQFAVTGAGLTLQADGYQWSGTATGVIDADTITGVFDGTAAGSFTLTRVSGAEPTHEK